jgi:hypothetical protein
MLTWAALEAVLSGVFSGVFGRFAGGDMSIIGIFSMILASIGLFRMNIGFPAIMVILLSFGFLLLTFGLLPSIIWAAALLIAAGIVLLAILKVIQ